ncbi:MAG: reverse transcriptase domain-containing protein, partial [Caldilineaceae bacterium]
MNANQHFVNIAHKLGVEKKPLEGVFRRMLDKPLFMQAYGNLASNKGSVTPGTDVSDIADRMSEERIEKIIKDLKDKTYQWKPARRIYIPKKNGGTRPLGIPSFTDKLVQEVMRIILEAYYEPQFRNSSHGFRPKRSCHTALATIERTWLGTKWFIEGDIKGCFDNINHEKLLEILGKRIKDNQFLSLIRKMLKAGYLEEWKYKATHSGTPQGGVISPILSNILLHELDEWIEDELIPKYTGKEKRNYYTPYWSQRRMYVYNRKRFRKTGKEVYRQRAKERKKAMNQLPSLDPQDNEYKRLRYVRYADDYLLGFVGSREEAKEIKELIRVKLEELGLEQSEEKTRITHASTEKASFLGFEIECDNDKRMAYAKLNGRSLRRRSINGHISLHIPQEVITKYIRRYSKKGKPHLKYSIVNHSDFEIIKSYGEIWRGLINYYMPARDVHKLNKVAYTMLESCVRTLCTKFKSKRHEIYRKYYGETSTGKKGLKCSFRNKITGKKHTTEFNEVRIKSGTWPTAALDYNAGWVGVYKGTELKRRLEAKKCELCGQEGNCEVHHVRALKDIENKKMKNQADIMMISRRRKQLIVCKKCHRKIH